jgi:hypothetical protein
MTSIEDLKKSFLSRYNPERCLERAIKRAIAAAVQRNALYAVGTSLEKKAEIRKCWGGFLRDYQTPNSEGDYERDVLRLQALINETFPGNFRDEFRISHSQKSLSVFLKHIWCMSPSTKPPPQCPVDRRTLVRAGCQGKAASWGYVNSMAEHREKIAALRNASGGRPLAEWELEAFAS